MTPSSSQGISLLGAISIMVAFGLVTVVAWLWSQERGSSMLRRWAKDSGFELLDSEYRLFFTGPFFWNSSKGQMIYRVRVRDAKGHVKSGWARCGSWFMGMYSDKVTVIWDDEEE